MTQTTDARSRPASYVYGIVPAGVRLRLTRRGVGEAGELRTVSTERAAAIVSTVAEVPVPATRANLMAHSDVLQEAVEASTVLPMRFGFVMASDEAVHDDLLVAREPELERLLANMGDRVEMSLKVYYLEDPLLASIVTEDPTIAELRETTRRLPPEAGYYHRIRLGELIVAAIESRRRRDSSHVLERLGPLAVETVTETDLPERTVLKASLLIERRDVPAFQRLVADLARELCESMQFTCVGPLPPYNFVRFASAAAAPVATR
jgi:hypothetical protein